MKLFIDENVSRLVVDRLRVDGHDLTRVMYCHIRYGARGDRGTEQLRLGMTLHFARRRIQMTSS